MSREAIDFAYAMGRELEFFLSQTACERAGAAATWERKNVAGKRVVAATDIEAVARAATVDLVAFLESARAELHARQEASRAA